MCLVTPSFVSILTNILEACGYEPHIHTWGRCRAASGRSSNQNTMKKKKNHIFGPEDRQVQQNRDESGSGKQRWRPVRDRRHLEDSLMFFPVRRTPVQFRSCNLPRPYLAANYVTFGVTRLLHMQPI